MTKNHGIRSEQCYTPLSSIGASTEQLRQISQPSSGNKYENFDIDSTFIVLSNPGQPAARALQMQPFLGVHRPHAAALGCCVRSLLPECYVIIDSTLCNNCSIYLTVHGSRSWRKAFFYKTVYAFTVRNSRCHVICIRDEQQQLSCHRHR